MVALPHERCYVRRKRFGETLREARKGFVAIPEDGERHSDWFAAQFQSGDLHTLALAPERRRDNGDSMPDVLTWDDVARELERTPPAPSP